MKYLQQIKTYKYLFPLIAFLLPFLFYLGVFFGRSFGIECTGAGVMGFKPPFNQSITAKNPYCHFIADIGAFGWQQYPQYVKVASEYSKFSWPLWNQNLGIGTPLAANFQSSAFFFPTILVSFFKSIFLFDLFFIARFGFASLGMYLFLRTFKLPKPLCLVGSAIFFANGYFTYIPTITHVSVDIFLPWIGFFINKAVETLKIKFFVLLSVVFATSNLAGFPEASLFNGLFFGVYSFFFCFFAFKKIRFKVFLSLACAGLLGLLLSAILILPGLEYIQNSASAHEIGVGQATSVSYWSFLSWAFPKLFGSLRSAAGFTTENLLYPWSGDYIGTFGVFFLIVTIFLLFQYWKTLKKYEFFSHYIFFVIFLGFMLATHFGLITNYIAKLPFFSQTQFPKYDLTLLHFLAATIVVFTLYKTSQLRATKTILSSFLLSLFLMFLIFVKFYDPASKFHFYKWVNLHLILTAQLFLSFFIITLTSFLIIFQNKFKNKSIVFLGLVVICVLELFIYIPFVGDLKRRDSFRKPPAVDFLKSLDYRESRIFSPDYILFPNHSADFDLNDVRNSDALWPINYYKYLKSFVVTDIDKAAFRFTGLKENETANEAQFLNNPYFDLLSVKYLLTYKSLGAVSTSQIPNPKDYKLIYDKEMKIYENQKFIPRLHPVNQLVCASSNKQVLEKMISQKAEIKTLAIVYSKECKEKNFDSTKIKIENQEFKDNQVTFTYQSNNESYIILSNVYYPGWKAKVNSKEFDLDKVNSTFQGLRLPKTVRGEVEIYYDPSSFKIGLLVSSVTFFLCFFAFVKFGNKQINYDET